MKKLSLLIFVFVFYSAACSETIISSEDMYLINGAQVFVLDERYDGNLDLFFKFFLEYFIIIKTEAT